jgi:hypothetical protein
MLNVILLLHRLQTIIFFPQFQYGEIQSSNLDTYRTVAYSAQVRLQLLDSIGSDGQGVHVLTSLAHVGPCEACHILDHIVSRVAMTSTNHRVIQG